MEIFTLALNMMREHIRPSSRIHYAVIRAGDVPNVVPAYAKVWLWLRDSDRAVVDEMLGRVKKIAEGAALAAGVESKVTLQGGDWNVLSNMAGQRAAWRNLEWLGPIPFTPEEQQFARTIQKENGVEEKGLTTALKPLEENPPPPEGGSTDVGDVSWNVPTIHISVTTAAAGAPWHGWPVVATGGMSIGHKGMVHASKALAATMIDLFKDPKLLSEIRAEFSKEVEGTIYRPYIPDGPPVPPPTK
jgi:aminobenzoyl-glutamate utilization protein B